LSQASELRLTIYKGVMPSSPKVFNMNYVAKNQDVLGPQLVKEYNIKSMIACSTCHY